jgi:photosystem II stability/assembly factor-like uncharacterized protein
MNVLEDLPTGPQLRPERVEADKTVISAAVCEAKPTVRRFLPQGSVLGPILKHRSVSRRVVIASAFSAIALAVIIALVAAPAPRTPGGPHQPAASPGSQSGGAPTWRLVSDVSPTWRALPSSGDVPGQPKGLNFSCPTTTTCYAANFASTGPGTASAVEVTNDGGTAWRALTLPVSLLRPPSLACVNAATCAILGLNQSGDSTFLETTDGGQTWSSHAGPNELTFLNGPFQLACTTPTSCLVVAPGTSTKVPPGTIVTAAGAASYVTDNGGDTWSTSSLPTGYIPSALQCASATNCVTTGSVSLGGPPLPSRAAILHTTNDGSNWVTASLPSQVANQTIFAPSSLSCADTENCLAIFSDGDSSAVDVLSSTDGGATWAATNSTGLGQVGVMSLSCPSSSDCWVAGVTNSSGKSADISATAGVVTSTTDSGTTWQEAQLPQGVGAIVDISCPNESSCFALAVRQDNGNSDVPQPFVLLASDNPSSGT